MNNNACKKIKISLMLIFLAVFSVFLLNAEYCISAPTHKPPQKVTVKYDAEAEMYKKAEIELSKNLYQLYRITERISRANNLNDVSWRVSLPYRQTKYKKKNNKEDENNSDKDDDNTEFNAYTKDGNLVVILPGLMDAFNGDINILAFVVAHEMSHERLKHMPQSMKDKEEYQEKVKDLNANDKLNRDDYTIGTYHRNSFYNYYNQKNKQEADNELKQKTDELNLDLLASQRSREYASDKLALSYMAKAGFNPNGALRFFDFLNYVDAYQENTSDHPTSKNRIYHVKNALATLNIKALQAEGLRNIKNSKPLPYDKSCNSRIVIVHSKYSMGETPDAPFKRMFGK